MKNKKILMGVLAVVLVLISFFMISGRSKSQKTENTDILPTEAVIQSVDESVIVDLNLNSARTFFTISVDNAPAGTEKIEYELSYDTAQQGLQGAVGALKKSTKKGSFSITKELGTCSSGTCVYHKVTGKMNLYLKFTGSYGEKAYEKEFAI